jgi:hypothetical protein
MRVAAKVADSRIASALPRSRAESTLVSSAAVGVRAQSQWARDPWREGGRRVRSGICVATKTDALLARGSGPLVPYAAFSWTTRCEMPKARTGVLSRQ